MNSGSVPVQNLADFPRGLGGREASWTAEALYRFCIERTKAHDKVLPVIRFTRVVKATQQRAHSKTWRTSLAAWVGARRVMTDD